MIITKPVRYLNDLCAIDKKKELCKRDHIIYHTISKKELQY